MAAHLNPEQLARAVQLQRRLWTQERIAADLGVNQSTVSRALARYNARALKRLERRVAAIKAAQVDQLEYLASQAAEAWERSLQDEERIKTLDTTKTVETDSGIAGVGPTVKTETLNRTETSIKGQSGNPALIREAREALADVRAILGLDAPPPRAKEEEIGSDFVIDLSADADDDDPEDDPPQQVDGPAA